MEPIVNLMKTIHRGVSWISQACLLISSVAIVVLLAIFGWLVWGRYVVNVTPTWVEQLALLLVCYITFLGAATGVYEDTHLGVQFVREALPDVIRKPLRILVDLILMVFGFFMFVSCMELVQFGWDNILPMLGVSEGIRTLPAAIFGLLCALFAGSHAISKTYLYYFAEPAEQELASAKTAQEEVN